MVRHRRRRPLLAHPHLHRPGAEPLPLLVHRQVQPGALLLGKFRHGRDPILRPPRAGEPEGRPGHSRGLLARGQQLRVVARRRRPRPPGFKDAPVEPAAAFYSDAFSEFVLPYDAVRASPDPEDALLRFCQSTYVAAADAGGWDRASLERRTT